MSLTPRQLENQRRYRENNREKIRAAQARSNAKRNEKYRNDPEYRAQRLALDKARYEARRAAGVTVHHVAPAEVFARYLAEQGGVCAICRRPESAKDPSGRTKRLAVDHDHVTGAVRGVLCSRCNSAIGLFHHDPERIQAAVDYLVRHGLRLVG